MIGMGTRDSEKRAGRGKKRQTRAQRHAFWGEAPEALRKRMTRFETVGPSKKRS